MKEPKVTVLMSVYNGEKYLREAIESILNQTYKDFEFLIINDGSTDSTYLFLSIYINVMYKFLKSDNNDNISDSDNPFLVNISNAYKYSVRLIRFPYFMLSHGTSESSYKMYSKSCTAYLIDGLVKLNFLPDSSSTNS